MGSLPPPRQACLPRLTSFCSSLVFSSSRSSLGSRAACSRSASCCFCTISSFFRASSWDCFSFCWRSSVTRSTYLCGALGKCGVRRRNPCSPTHLPGKGRLRQPNPKPASRPPHPEPPLCEAFGSRFPVLLGKQSLPAHLKPPRPAPREPVTPAVTELLWEAQKSAEGSWRRGTQGVGAAQDGGPPPHAPERPHVRGKAGPW